MNDPFLHLGYEMAKAKAYRVYIQLLDFRVGQRGSKTSVELLVSNDVVLDRKVLQQGTVLLTDESALWPAIGGDARLLPVWTNIHDNLERLCMARDGCWRLDMSRDGYSDVLFPYEGSEQEQRQLALS